MNGYNKKLPKLMYAQINDTKKGENIHFVDLMYLHVVKNVYFLPREPMSW